MCELHIGGKKKKEISRKRPKMPENAALMPKKKE